MILEVSRKQGYIFARRRLRENVERSQQIRSVTESGFFREAADDLYNESENLVYSGGGHTVLQFPDKESANAFARRVSSAVVRRYPDMELYVKQEDYDPSLSPGDNLRKLTGALERKKALRRASFRQLSLGVEKLSAESWTLDCREEHGTSADLREQVAPPEGFRYPLEFNQLVKAADSGTSVPDNYIAVVHIDGNAMGKRVDSLLETVTEWNEACRLLSQFSSGVDKDYSEAFCETVIRMLRCRPQLCEQVYLPIRPIILAGDDVCFVTAGSLGLECARLFLEALSAKNNSGDGKGYAACAGVVLVHQKYPFHMAYQLSEELCSTAKRYGQSLDSEGRISAMDWHIEFGQLKDGLREIREDYATEDGNRLELRPVTVVTPLDYIADDVGLVRSYAFFRGLCSMLRREYGKIARGKLKELRTALKQGETETRFFLADKQISDILYHPFEAKYQASDSYREALKRILEAKEATNKEAFSLLGKDGIKRSLFFDALEMIDHFEPLEEVTEQ